MNNDSPTTVIRERFRLQRLVMESPSDLKPTASSSSSCAASTSATATSSSSAMAASPMTELAHNMSDACIDNTPSRIDHRRRLSLDCSPSPLGPSLPPSTPTQTTKCIPGLTDNTSLTSTPLSAIENLPNRILNLDSTGQHGNGSHTSLKSKSSESQKRRDWTLGLGLSVDPATVKENVPHLSSPHDQQQPPQFRLFASSPCCLIRSPSAPPNACLAGKRGPAFDDLTPLQNKRRRGLERPPPPCADRSLSLTEDSQVKEFKLNSSRDHESSSVRFQRSMSETAANIMLACSRADLPNRTGDTLRPLALPVLPASATKHPDLRTISVHTVADLVSGKYKDTIASYRVIDARYVYEFVGGHIRGAENFGSWDEMSFFREFLPPGSKPLKPSSSSESVPSITATDSSSSVDSRKDSGENSESTSASPVTDPPRHVLIFHCEFSSARGPELMKKLRKRDRDLNKDVYPALYFPELYLMHNGYKEFFEQYQELCEPQSYQPMKDPRFLKQERQFRTKSKSWAGGTVARTGTSSRLLKL